MTTYPNDDIRILILGQDDTIWLISPVALDRATDVMFGVGKLKKEYLVSENKSIAAAEILKKLGAAEKYADIISAFGYARENCGCLDGL